MSYTIELIDNCKSSMGAPSDYALAKMLGINPNAVSNYRTGLSHADDKTAILLADALKLDRLKTIAKINVDRARKAEDRTFWRKIAATAAAVLAFTASPALLSISQGLGYLHIM